ncbi:site-specific DNA-methyltransferase [Helicobacter sp. 11S03491-1]|uniref:DNA-methyltransferase n=1 Tax=Helicobacter sp. 11S03491-1 TaxID=1476196 RepID=UPI000BA61057|nr:site-specific DNA-methyltransferase [Helicobacter sp. 11S03491-1]PAF43318.1 SAM-dependent methyltransferase [Helicobacter sp. 11S03491-1]
MKAKTQTSSFGVSKRIGHDSKKFYQSKLYEGVIVQKNKKKYENLIQKDKMNQIYDHSSEQMNEIPDNSIHLMVTSPPYNVSKDYDEDLSLNQYLEFLKNVFRETKRVLVEGGRVCINVANIGRKPYIPLTTHINTVMLELGFLMRGEIIWDKSASSGVSMAWGSFKSASNPVLRDTHEYILIFSKGDFKREKNNKNDSISKDDFMQWSKSVWQFNAISAKKIGHPAPFPIELPRRLIEFYSFEDDIILDPFIGSGTTAIAALQLNRNYIGYEINAQYLKLANKRITELKNTLF